MTAAALAAAPGGGGAPSRELARQILTEARFHPPPLPRPLHGVLDALGGALAPLGRALEDAFDWIAGVLPGGDATVWVLLGGLVLAVAAIASGRVLERTVVIRGDGRHRASAGGLRGDGADQPDARALEAAALEAERVGELSLAVRLRFRAGLLALDELGVVAYRPSLSNAAVARRLRSPGFDALARRFEEIAYGGRPATPADVAGAREAWARVLGERAAR